MKQKLTENTLLGNPRVVENVIHDVAVLGSFSSNGKGRQYTRKYMESAKPLYEGIAVTVNHPSKKQRQLNEDRGVLVKVGKLKGITIEETAKGPRMKASQLVMNPNYEHYGHLKWMAENTPEHLGLSHDVIASGKVNKNDGKFIAESCVKAFEVALVSSPGTNQTLFESLENAETKSTEELILDKLSVLETAFNAINNKTERTDAGMQYNELTLEQLAKNRPDLIELVQLKSQETAEQKAKREADQKELEEYRQYKKTQLAKDKAIELCKEAEMNESLMSDLFIKTLSAIEDKEHQKLLIEDRIKASGQKPNTNTGIKSSSKNMAQQTGVTENQQATQADLNESFSGFNGDNKALAAALLEPRY